MTSPAQKSVNELAEERTALAAKRTQMAADRSLMAWVRTALSMITFGFTVYKVLQGFHASGDTARTAGLFLIGMGTLAMVIGAMDYWLQVRELRQLRHFPLWRPSFVVAVFMAVMGLLLFVSVIGRTL